MKVALVGCGRIAERHAELLATNKIQGLSLASVVDVKPERAEKLGKKSAKTFNSNGH